MKYFELGKETARALTIEGRYSGRRAANVLRKAVKELEETQANLNRRNWERFPAAVEWFLDNFYLVRQEGKDAEMALRRGKRLRRAGDCAYIQALAASFAEQALTAEPGEIVQYLTGIQEIEAMTEEELSLFPNALAGAYCQRLAELSNILKSEPDQVGLADKMKGIFTALRTIGIANLGAKLENSSPVEKILRMDPAGFYAGMDEGTRARYRARVCLLARHYGLKETETAQKALELARKGQDIKKHIGWFLFREPLGQQEKNASGVLYVGAILLPTLCLALWLGFKLNSWVLFFLLLLPASDLMKNLVDFLAVRLVRPRPVLRMELKDGIPKEGRTLCVIAGLLTSEKSGDSYAALLERYRLANRDSGKELRFGLLADLPDRDAPMGAEQRKWVKKARAAIEALNEKYDDGFYLFFRQPSFQRTDERYVGWERKRGALLELARLLRKEDSSLEILAGKERELAGTKYVITLDSDTALNVGAARELVGAMLHPLNRPQIDSRRKVVIAGYGLLQPRIGVELNAANHSQFSRIFAGQGGIDPYGGACSDVYQDLFDRGTYTGKGIFDVDAFLQCLDGRFPQERILSHDLLEGAYLHAGLLEDVELTDGYPYKVTSYFSRLHRWIRGDWQLLPWLRSWVRNERGERAENPISSVDKWKLFDNLRRSVSPIFTLLAIFLGMCQSAPVLGAAAALAIVSAWSNLLLTGADLAFRGGVGLRRRYHSTVIAGPGGMILQILVQLLFLPYHAWISASAILTALWRSFISHKKMLEWTTAADAERKKDDFAANFRAQWPAVAVGFFAVALAQFPAGAAMGLIWIVSPVFAWALSRPLQQKRTASEDDRPFLMHQAALMWGYFRDWLQPEDHWLPPDNVQEKPWLGPARRTSPTNIGMALLSCIAAVDLELTNQSKATELISHMLDTLEMLPKWKGHLYNWYDTSDCRPLRPRYISTVDSGNLRGCLIALREALYEWGEDGLARRAEALSDGMNLSPLYDNERKLFMIGYDVEKDEYTAGWYDLMASEARLASYLAIALGEVEPRHWRRLGRGLVGDNDYCGMVSWTGTMFEYFMPNLLLPDEQGSLMYESLSFCVYVQKRWGSKVGRPWGVSESGFYAFDPGMAYQYKAHGVQTLGLRRGLDQDLVVAPYASFLALLLAPRSASRNLRRLRDMGLEGTYGLFEAVDFTPNRLQGEPWSTVRSFMVHHVGMSLVAIDNTLKHSVMQDRFMRDCSMGAFRELLQEKVPVGAPIIKPDRGNAPERPKLRFQSQFCRSGIGYDLDQPASHLLSNGLVAAFCTDAGAVRLTDDRGETPILTRFRERYAPAGVSFFYRSKDGKLSALTGAPMMENGAFAWSFDGAGATWTRKQADISTKIRFALAKEDRGGLWTVTLEGMSEGELICYLEPVIAREADYLAHPTYSKLSIESEAIDRGIRFTRRPREGSREAALVVLWDREEAQWETSREKGLGRGGLLHLEQALKNPAEENVGAVLDPCLLVRFPVRGGEKFRLRLALGFEDGKRQAERTAAALLSAPEQGTGRLEGVMRGLQLSAGEVERAMELMSALEFSHQDHGGIPQSALWAYDISGDLPIAVASVGKTGEKTDLFPLRAHELLRKCGYHFDLVYLATDGGDYLQSQKRSLLEVLKNQKMEQALGKKGGVHLVETHSGEKMEVWEAWAAVLFDSVGKWKTKVQKPIQAPDRPCVFQATLPQWHFSTEGEFVLQIDKNLPPLGWSHFLVNRNFGWITDETGCGHLWEENAREAPLTEWNNDPLAIGGPEWFFLTCDGKAYSLFADGDQVPVTVTYGFGWAKWEKYWPEGVVRTTALVPWDKNARIILVELPNRAGELRHVVKNQGESRYSFTEKLCLISDQTGTRRESDAQFDEFLLETKRKWKELTGGLKIKTPDNAINNYMNGWCPYQVIACRILGRTSRYQNGGAYGFRDQLQDVIALLQVEPSWAREQILRCCEHQFSEGDVQHWWHEAEGEKFRGVRTRISDDLLWLPYALGRYLETWSDWGILNEQVNYLSGEPLRPGEKERYYVPECTVEREGVYCHARRAIRCVIARGVGEHGLLKMGTGDWNDGMNEVGAAGRGESVWLTWFAVCTLEKFQPIAERQGDDETAELCREWKEKLRIAAEKAWDGMWYLRGWYDDGTPVGGHTSEACQIDSIAQSWSILAGADPEKARIALRSALDRLVDRRAKTVQLFDPAFDHGREKPGYIKAYLPGIRENGGQYTHAAVWLALACCKVGWMEEGYELLQMLLPTTHDAADYQAEPYVLAGDVYTNPDHSGRGGWSWYTGAAGWYYQTAVQEFLGIRVKNGRLTVSPCLPRSWPGWSACWKTETGTLHIQVTRGEKETSLLDGTPVQSVPLREIRSDSHWEITVPEKEN